MGSGAPPQDGRGGGNTLAERWYSFCNFANPDTDTLDELLENMRWNPRYDAEGNICTLEFSGEKLGDDDYIFSQIAEFIEPGSFVDWEGEDGCQWRWDFGGSRKLMRR